MCSRRFALRTIDTKGWEDFIEEVRFLTDGREATFLYRGQTDSEWALSTTLERAGKDDIRITDYNRLISVIQPAVETFTGTNWGVPPYGLNDEDALKKYDEFSLGSFPAQNLYSYMVYLRHHGFPSPLLDWTQSPYIAAFFAFREARNIPRRAIYVFCERPTGLKMTSNHKPHIRPMGPYVTTHRRHFRQQSNYTLCASYIQSEWRYTSHQRVLDEEHSDQDKVWKFTIPSTERLRVLQILNDYNLNAYSLFDSEESLMETMWLREVLLTSAAVRERYISNLLETEDR